MAENDTPDRLPALPAPQLPALPPGMDVDEYRRFQEFQRFQDYQRLLEHRGGTPGDGPPGLITPYGGTPLHATAIDAPPAQHEIAEQLAGVRQHLADLATTQARIDQTINPPRWGRILRSRLVRLLIWLGIVAIIGSVGLPLLIDGMINMLFANHNNTDPNGGRFHTKAESGMASNSRGAVVVVYRYIAKNNPAQVCDGSGLIAELEFAKATNTATCEDAVSKLARQVTDPTSYANPNLDELPTPAGDTDTISSCEFIVTGGPRLGTFTMTRQLGGWEITGYFPPAVCPTSTTPTNR